MSSCGADTTMKTLVEQGAAESRRRKLADITQASETIANEYEDECKRLKLEHKTKTFELKQRLERKNRILLNELYQIHNNTNEEEMVARAGMGAAITSWSKDLRELNALRNTTEAEFRSAMKDMDKPHYELQSRMHALGLQMKTITLTMNKTLDEFMQQTYISTDVLSGTDIQDIVNDAEETVDDEVQL